MDVEVVFHEICSAYYEAKLLDVDTANGRCQVRFENDWKPKCWVGLQDVRYGPVSPSAALELAPGMRVEAYLPHKEGEPQGWWVATITKCKGEVAGIQFVVGDQEFTDLVDISSLRKPNESSSLSQVQFYQKDFPVPDDIQDFCSDLKVHQNFRTKTKALGVSYDADRQSLVVVADDKSSLTKAELLIDIHLSDLSTQATLLSKTQKASQMLEQNSQPRSVVIGSNSEGIHEEKFHLHPDCIGFAMGKQGWNVNQAREIEGIISIDFDDNYSMFTIRAHTREAAEEARNLIEFTRDMVMVPRDLAGKVIGRGGNIVQQILEKSRLNNIKVIGDQEARDRNITTDGGVS